jgi:hypothetical protein
VVEGLLHRHLNPDYAGWMSFSPAEQEAELSWERAASSVVLQRHSPRGEIDRSQPSMERPERRRVGGYRGAVEYSHALGIDTMTVACPIL